MPNFHACYTKYDPSDKKSIFLEAFLRYLSVTREEYKDLVMETTFEFETKPLMRWFIEEYAQKGEKIADIGGATGIQWKIFQNKLKKNKHQVYVIDIDRHSIEWGKKHNQLEGVSFLHTTELDQIDDRQVDTILLCEVYMQLPRPIETLRLYARKFPGAKVVIIHSTFPNTFTTRVFSWFKQHIIPYTYLSVIQGRAMVDQVFFKEIADAGFEVTKEVDLNHLSYSKRLFGNQLKAFVLTPRI